MRRFACGRSCKQSWPTPRVVAERPATVSYSVLHCLLAVLSPKKLAALPQDAPLCCHSCLSTPTTCCSASQTQDMKVKCPSLTQHAHLCFHNAHSRPACTVHFFIHSMPTARTPSWVFLALNSRRSSHSLNLWMMSLPTAAPVLLLLLLLPLPAPSSCELPTCSPGRSCKSFLPHSAPGESLLDWQSL